MRKKKVIAVVTSAALLLAVTIGATLAYFTDRAEKVNTITMGKVDIDLDEPNFDPGDDDDTVENVMPNQTIVKDPTITVVPGSEACYIRTSLAVTGLESLTGYDAELLKGIVFGNEDPAIADAPATLASDWVLGEDGYYYYQKMIEKSPDAQKIVFFNQVVIPDRWGNEVAEKQIKLTVGAEAIQADNFTPTTDQNGIITSWMYSDGTPITPETYEESNK